MPVPLSVPAFVTGIAKRGLSLHVEGEKLVLLGPDEAQTDKVCAYIRARKPDIIEYLTSPQDCDEAIVEREVAPEEDAFSESRAGQSAFLAELDANEYRDGLLDFGGADDIDAQVQSIDLPDDLPPVDAAAEFEDAAAPEIAERVRQVYIAARASLLPIERVSLGPGHTCANPNAYVVRCLERIEIARRSLPLIGWAAYLDNLLTERTGVVAVAAWWDTNKTATCR